MSLPFMSSSIRMRSPNKFETEIIKALGVLLKNETNYDVIIYIGEKPDFKEFHAHSGFLCCRSDYFNKILSARDVEKKDRKYVIRMPNITPQAFDVIIKFLYIGSIDINNKSGIEILNIMIAFNDLKLNQLIEEAERFFIRKRHQFFQNDSVEILKIIYCHQIFNMIQNRCLETICAEPGILFTPAKFIDLPAHILEVILKRDDLGLISEIKIWNSLIKWGIAKETTLISEDVSKWRREKFYILERILYRFIPLIRFYDISSEDYFNKVQPYEKILPKELRKEILKFYMVPGYKSTSNNLLPRHTKFHDVDSVLINQNHFAIFANWINQKVVGSYNFKLLYRASKDGKSVVAFHEKCDNRGANIVVAKIKNSEQIVGGYNPVFWDSTISWKDSNYSFIFSFINRTDLQTAKLGNCNNCYSIRCNPNYGPIFGDYNLFCGNYVWRYDDQKDFYSKVDGIKTGDFNVDDYEVFQVIKR